MTKRLVTLALAALLAAGVAARADERALRSAFEGRQVELLIDLPASTKGLDYYPTKRARYDMGKHQSRLMSDGIGVRSGGYEVVTLIKVKGKHIEFQLGAGGKSQKPRKESVYVPKSELEKELEDQIKDASTDDEKKRLRRMLKSEQNRRRQQEKLQKSLAEQQYKLALGDRTEAEWDVMAGSRINLRFDGGVPAKVLTPEGFRAALDGYVNFDPKPRAAPTAADTATGPLPVAAASQSGTFPIKKGQARVDVDGLFGGPEKCTEEDQGSFKINICTYRLEEANLDASFIDGVLVRYVLMSN